jgi:hypothetical protein
MKYNKGSITLLKSIMAATLFCFLFFMLSCQMPVKASNQEVVPIYVLDKRDVGGDVQVTLKKPYLTGQGEASQHIEVHYVSPDIAKKLAENPELINSLIKK